MTAALSDQDLMQAARGVVARSYAPFSKFKAGTVVCTDGGDLVPGVIVENVSLGLSMCAERVALFATVARGSTPTAIALAAPDTDGGMTWPCGACVQVALELGGPDLVIVVGDADSGATERATVGALLPRGPHVDL